MRRRTSEIAQHARGHGAQSAAPRRAGAAADSGPVVPARFGHARPGAVSRMIFAGWRGGGVERWHKRISGVNRPGGSAAEDESGTGQACTAAAASGVLGAHPCTGGHSQHLATRPPEVSGRPTVIRSVLTLRAAAGQARALEEFYAEHGILDRARKFGGCRDALLLRSVDGGPATHLVIADWDTAADYRRWVDDPWRAAVSRQLAALLDTESDEPLVGGVFELVAPGEIRPFPVDPLHRRNHVLPSPEEHQ
jgi:heme-degrading monooxygenase HmoA